MRFRQAGGRFDTCLLCFARCPNRCKVPVLFFTSLCSQMDMQCYHELLNSGPNGGRVSEKCRNEQATANGFISIKNLYFDTQFRHRTGVHSDADSPLARGPLRPLTTAMYSISRRAGPLIGLAPPGSFRRIFISVIFFRIPCSRRPPAPRLRAAACGVPVRRTTWRSCLTQFTGKIIFDFTGKVFIRYFTGKVFISTPRISQAKF